MNDEIQKKSDTDNRDEFKCIIGIIGIIFSIILLFIAMSNPGSWSDVMASLSMDIRNLIIIISIAIGIGSFLMVREELKKAD